MTQSSERRASRQVSREEKYNILSSILGAETMKRIDEARVSESPTIEVLKRDSEILEWQNNPLLEKFRNSCSKIENSQDTPKFASENEESSKRERPHSKWGVDQRLFRFADRSALSAEHPAVITRLLSGMGRTERIDALRSLPGPVARAVVQRLK